MGVAVLVNIVGSVSAIVGIVLYAKELSGISISEDCDIYNDNKNICLYLAFAAQVSVLVKDTASSFNRDLQKGTVYSSLFSLDIRVC